MSFVPLADYILVKPVRRLQSRILDVVSNEKYSRGLVIAVGPGERLKRKNGSETGAIRPMQVKPGDWVTVENHGRYGDYSEAGTDFWVMQEKDVAFISERSHIDAHNSLADAEIDALIAAHNKPLELRAA